jgi:hypothetical protein
MATADLTLPPGRKRPGYAENEKPAKAGSKINAPPPIPSSRLQPALLLSRSPGVYARAGWRDEAEATPCP